jgi:hypothetical protein
MAHCRYSYRSASTELNFAALRAGYRPKSILTPILNTIAPDAYDHENMGEIIMLSIA